jgi:hypothetical protein
MSATSSRSPRRAGSGSRLWSSRRASSCLPKQIAHGGPVGNLVGEAISMISSKEVRVSVLGHVQPGGSPSPYDRVPATRFGVAAVDLIAEGGFGKMVALPADSIVALDEARAIGIEFGDKLLLERRCCNVSARSGRSDAGRGYQQHLRGDFNHIPDLTFV